MLLLEVNHARLRGTPAVSNEEGSSRDITIAILCILLEYNETKGIERGVWQETTIGLLVSKVIYGHFCNRQMSNENHWETER